MLTPISTPGVSRDSSHSDLERLEAQFPALEFHSNHSLSPYTYMKSGGPADIFVTVQSRLDLENLVSFCVKNNQKHFIFGGASNLLIPDEGMRGLVIRNLANKVSIIPINDTESIVEADSGAITNIFCRKTIDESLTGLENFMGVPGSIGGAIYNNAHYLNDLIGDYIQDVEVIAKSGEKKVYTREQLAFKYEYSILQDTHETMTLARFKLKKGIKSEIEEKAKSAAVRRASTQPLGIPSSGCMFKNPVMPDGTQGFAGKLIDEAGLKGTRVGDAIVSEKHANFILNTGKATTEDILALADKVTQVIKEKYGVELEREVFLVH
jgi:UDP-N-acetylmuramate dehydrogenase